MSVTYYNKAPIGMAAMRSAGTTPGNTSKTTDPFLPRNLAVNATNNNNTNSNSNNNTVQNKPSTSSNNSTVNLQNSYKAQQNDLASQLQSVQAWYEQQLREQQEAQQRAAQNAYNSNMSALENAYSNRISGLDSNYASTKENLASSYGNSVENLNASAEKALQEAYINRMMNEKNLRQQLNAQGLNGGASESAIASMLNNYGNSRNNINTATTNSLKSLEETYNNNMANALQNYNDALSAAEDTRMAYRMQLENDLANSIIGSYSNLYNGLSNMDSNYVNAMTDLITRQSAASADLQSTLAKKVLDNTLSAAKAEISGNNSSSVEADLVNKVKQLYKNGATFDEIAQSPIFEGYNDPEYIAQIFAKAEIPF